MHLRHRPSPSSAKALSHSDSPIEAKPAPTPTPRLTPQSVLQLQTTIGNRAVRRLLQTNSRRVQRYIFQDDMGDEPYDPDITYVQSKWGFNDAEKNIYLQWLKDKIAHRYPTKAALIAAIKTAAQQGGGVNQPVALQQPFGSAVSITTAKATFLDALNIGYRTFDTAYSYATLEALFEAAQESGVPLNQIKIIYKIKPEELLGLAQAETQIKQLISVSLQNTIPGVIMLHEMGNSRAETIKCLLILAQCVKEGRATNLGVSNVDLDDLIYLHQVALDVGVPIKVVQNRFSPYVQDQAVRLFCQEHQIQYMAYGLMGTQQSGVCGQQQTEFPPRYLLALHDSRLIALAKQFNLSVGQLLLAWARQKGICVVEFSRESEKRKENFQSGLLQLDQRLIAEIDRLVTEVSEESEVQKEKSPLQPLYLAYHDPTAWYILDVMTHYPNIANLFIQAILKIRQKNSDNSEGANNDLKNVVLSLIRFVADIQSYLAAVKAGKQQSMGFEIWEAGIGILFAQHLPDQPSEQSILRFCQWGANLEVMRYDFLVGVNKFVGMFDPATDESENRLRVGSKVTLTAANNKFLEDPDGDVVAFAEAKVGQQYECMVEEHKVKVKLLSKPTDDKIIAEIVG